jgi:hypothetical protein
MAIRVGGTDVIDNSLGLKNIASVDATTADAISAAGVGGGKADFVASGTIANGDVVILNSDGTVTSAGLEPTVVGSEIQLAATDTTHHVSCFDSTNNKVILFYDDNTNGFVYGVVGTVSGNSITFGTPTAVYGLSATYITCVYDSVNQKVLVNVVKNTTGHHLCYVGTVSGTSISFGSSQSWFSPGSGVYARDVNMIYDSTNGKAVIVYRDPTDSYYGKAIVATVSGTTVSFGTAVTFETGSISDPTATFDSSNGKVVIAYRLPNELYSIVGTVSGTSISFGTSVQVTTGTTSPDLIRAAYDSTSSKVIVAFMNGSYEGKVIVGTVSGTSISYGSETTYYVGNSSNRPYADSIVHDTSANKFVIGFIVYRQFGTELGRLAIGEVSGTTSTISTTVDFNSGGNTRWSLQNYIGLSYDSSNSRVVVSFSDASVSNYGKVQVVTTGGSTNLTDTNLIGVSTEAISDTATGTINIIGGINESQTGLTTGTTYYAANDGSLSTTNNGRKVGKAISSTKLLVDTAMSGPEMNTYLGGLV